MDFVYKRQSLKIFLKTFFVFLAARFELQILQTLIAFAILFGVLQNKA
jgi:hypothetical protein